MKLFFLMLRNIPATLWKSWVCYKEDEAYLARLGKILNRQSLDLQAEAMGTKRKKGENNDALRIRMLRIAAWGLKGNE